MKKMLTTTLMLLAITGLSSEGTAEEKGSYEGQMFDEAVEAPAENDSSRLQEPQALTGKPESTGYVVGIVTLVGDDMIRLVELDSGVEHQIRVTDAQEKALTTGYAIKAEIKDGRLVSYGEMGVPPDVADIVYTAEDLPTDNILLQQPQSPYYEPAESEDRPESVLQ